MKSRRKRSAPLSVCALEGRILLSGTPTGVWLGQDGHDLVGPSSAPGGDGVQDVHIAISGLPADRTITFADVQGLGGDDWQYNGAWGPWKAAIVRAPGSTSADLYIEPAQKETGRPFSINLTYDDGSTTGFWVTGGAADPNLRMPSAALQVQWLGQDGHDLVGAGPAVGPDGIQDVHLALSHLSATDGITSVLVTGPTGDAWQYGLNAAAENNAELVRNASDPSLADLYLNPIGNLGNQPITVTVVYSNNTTDTAHLTGGATNASLTVAPPAPVALTWNQVSARWVGQDGQNLVGLGDVHLALAGLPSGRHVAAAALSDGVAGSWVYQNGTAPGFNADQFALPMAFRTSNSAGTTADLDFPPVRSELNTTMTLRLVFSDGTSTVTQFAGGSSDVSLRSPAPAATSVVAHPGADLNALANHFGTVHLTAGTYNLSQPLILNNPVTITADPGATLVFSQTATDVPWTAAIKIESGHTTLNGFAVRFATPVRWNLNVNYGPAVIGTTDNFDAAGHNDPRAGIVITNLDLQSPPASSTWEEAPRLIRVVTAASGRIAGNTLKGGTTEFLNGPWEIVNNTYNGTVPNTYSYAVFAGHNTHDLVLEGNTAQPVGASGKTWRFLVMTVSGSNDLVANNTSVGIGPQDSDTVPGANAAEVILTEAYQVHFEGVPAAISPDGHTLQIPTPQGGPARTGDVVSILSGPSAGQWRRITQAISPTTYLMNQPLPAGSYAISISTGFVNEGFTGNTIDTRGSSVAADLVLAGNHFGTRVVGNTFLGGQGIVIAASPTEQPVQWGWTHAPFLGSLIANNTIIDALSGGVITVEHSSAIKSNQGRVYMSVSLINNTVEWTDAFLAHRAQAGVKTPLLAFTIGDPASIDTGELLIQATGNQVRGPAGFVPGTSLLVNSATLNGQAELDQKFALPNAPTVPAPAPAAPLSGVWLGQDGHDFVGPWPVQVPDGIQDIHIALSGLRPDRTVTSIDVEGLGGGQWMYNGPWGPWKVALVRAAGSGNADIYIQPYQLETGRSFSVVITYDDGSQASTWVVGGKADPTLHMPTSAPLAPAVFTNGSAAQFITGAPHPSAGSARLLTALGKHQAPTAKVHSVAAARHVVLLKKTRKK